MVVHSKKPLSPLGGKGLGIGGGFNQHRFRSRMHYQFSFTRVYTFPVRKIVFPASVLAVLIIASPVAKAFFDDLTALRQELVTWETTHAADFSDLINTLDDISGVQFGDVAEGDWFNPYVQSVASWGIISGYRGTDGKPTGEFGPSNNVTVAEMLKVALKTAHVDETQCGLVPPEHLQAIGHWAAAFVSCGEGLDMRILRDPDIDLDRPATRAEVVAMIDDAFGDNVPPLYSNFRDTAGHPLEADIAYAYTRGIITGDKDKLNIETGTFRPDAPINRAEVAKIVYQRLKVDATAETAAQ